MELKYKALFKKMMDDLKDGQMLMDWAKELSKDCPEVSKYLLEVAETRVTGDFNKTMTFVDTMFDKEMTKEFDFLLDELDDWKEELVSKMKRM